MSGVERCAYAAVIQHYIASLHAFTIPASPQWLIEAFKIKATLAVTKDPTSHPTTSIGTGLLSSHSYVVHHVVDGAKEWRNLTEETVMR